MHSVLDLALETPVLQSFVISGTSLCEPAIEAIFDGRYPLRRLGLFTVGDSDYEDSLAQRWLRSNLFPRLEAIGRTWNEMSEEGSRAFAKQLAPWAEKRVFGNPFAHTGSFTTSA